MRRGIEGLRKEGDVVQGVVRIEGLHCFGDFAAEEEIAETLMEIKHFGLVARVMK